MWVSEIQQNKGTILKIYLLILTMINYYFSFEYFILYQITIQYNIIKYNTKQQAMKQQQQQQQGHHHSSQTQSQSKKQSQTLTKTQLQSQLHHDTKTIRYKSLFIEYKPVKLILYRNFNTAHSSSATRTNFFVRVGSERPEIYCKQYMYGFGEAGLPPKKPGCYMADIHDCLTFMTKLHQDLTTSMTSSSHNKVQTNQQQQYQHQQHKEQNTSNLYLQLQMPYELALRVGQYKTSIRRQIFQLLCLLQKYNKIDEFRAAKCALEFALLDLFGKYHQVNLSEFLTININKNSSSSNNVKQNQNKQNPHQHSHQHKHQHQYSYSHSYSFYTASLQPHQNMLANIREHTKMTKYIKIKYNNDIDGLIELLRVIQHKEEEVQQEFKCVRKYIIDANCSWTCEDFSKFNSKLQSIGNGFVNKILYIQQPFDLDISDSQNWAKIKAVSPIKILADESFRNQHDINRVKAVAHAVNIKTQKTGGPFATLQATLAALSSGLQVMFGSMCSTQLGCTQTFQFWPYAQYLDIDGALLVKQPQLKGGFEWVEDGRVVHYTDKNNKMEDKSEQSAQSGKRAGFGLDVQANILFSCQQKEVENQAKW